MGGPDDDLNLRGRWLLVALFTLAAASMVYFYHLYNR